MSKSANPFLEITAPGIENLKPYIPGKPVSELERELGIRDSIKLASNENPLGCSDRVRDAIAAEWPTYHVIRMGRIRAAQCSGEEA